MICWIKKCLLSARHPVEVYNLAWTVPFYGRVTSSASANLEKPDSSREKGTR